jgi:Domain of unknown function (DUF4386)
MTATKTAVRPSPRIVSARQRRAEIVIAALFVVQGVVSIIGAAVFLNPIFNAPGYLANVFPNRGAIELGAMLWAVNNIAIVFIAVFALPLLRKLDEALAVGYLAARIMEGVFLMAGTVAYLLMISLSQQFLSAGSPEGSWFLSYANILKQTAYIGLTQLDLVMLGIGGLIFTWMLFRYRLVHRYIGGLGLIGYALVFIVSILNWFGIVSTSGPIGVLVVPVAAFEIIVLPAWLFIRGFRMPSVTEMSEN